MQSQLKYLKGIKKIYVIKSELTSHLKRNKT
jgi:hypothetical protein